MSVKTNRFPTLLIPAVKPVISHVRQKALPLFIQMRCWLTRRNIFIGSAATFTFLTLAYSVGYFWPRNVAFSYAGGNCLTQPVLLPELVSDNSSQTYRAVPNASISVAGYPLYSQVTCVNPYAAPKENVHETISFGLLFFKKSIRVASGTYPYLHDKSLLEKPVSVQDPLGVKLSTSDLVFDYRLMAGDKQVDCDKQKDFVQCDVAKLELKQSKKYDFELVRQFKGTETGSLFEDSLATVDNVNVKSASISNGQIVYNKPSRLVLTLNREAATADGAKLFSVSSGKRQEVKTETSFEKNKLVISFKEPLARNTEFVFEAKRITAADGGYMASPYALKFKSSGGPKVAGVSIGTYAVPSGSSIVITFDSPVLASQDANKYVQVLAGGRDVKVSANVNGSQIIVTPSALGRCTPFTIKVLDGLQNKFGVSGGSAWQYDSRTLCQSVFGIGTSVLGRNITAYSFGGGAEKIIFVGGTHGNEYSSVYLMNSWVSYLEANAHRIPAGRTITIIPNLNPDGFAAGRRTNAHNVDLNRNFPANDWKKSVTMPGGSVSPSGGGSAPLSEPESKALANYVTSQSPKLVLTYHATGGVVIPNDSGNSASKAHIYDQNSDVYFLSNSSTGSFFPYDTTGSFETWLHDKVGIPTLLIELWTDAGYEFNGHVSAMWTMIH